MVYERKVQCVYHPDREAAWICVKCLQDICEECKVANQGYIYCKTCASELFSAKPETSADRDDTGALATENTSGEGKIAGKSRKGLGCLIPLCIIIAIILIPSDCEESNYISIDGAVAVGADGSPIELIDNPHATNPTFEQLMAFIKADKTDEIVYSETGRDDLLRHHDPFVCADFAEAVHNNAEAAGIRTAWVGVIFESEDIGHAVNAFETTNKGLVYVDCTGGNRGLVFSPDRLRALLGDEPMPSPPDSWDAIAYIEIGQEFGLIPIDSAESNLYSYYRKYEAQWDEYYIALSTYNDEVSEFNKAAQSKIYIIGTPEEQMMKEWEDRIVSARRHLDKLGDGLNEYWFEKGGKVESIHIFWGDE